MSPDVTTSIKWHNSMHGDRKIRLGYLRYGYQVLCYPFYFMQPLGKLSVKSTSTFLQSHPVLSSNEIDLLCYCT